MNIIQLALNEILPLHEASDEARVRAIVSTMRKIGWQGRPLLVYRLTSGRWQAITGSHRIASARIAGLSQIPCVIVENRTANLGGRMVSLYETMCACDNTKTFVQALCTFDVDREILGLMAVDGAQNPQDILADMDFRQFGEIVYARTKTGLM